MAGSVFDGIVDHERALAPLRRAADEGRLHPSLLFHGPEGIGKRLAAFALAAALNCRGPGARGCGECASCRRILKGYAEERLAGPSAARATAHHADVLYYPPRRRQIRIEQILDLCREAGLRPFEGRRRVFLVDPADAMNREAANALLKTLEEPPPAAVLVLITAHPEALPPTVRSRCQAVRFAPLAPGEVAALLAARGRAPREAERLAALADGSVGRALAIDLEAHDRLRGEVLEVLERAGAPGGLLAALGLAQAAGADAEEFERTVAVLAGLLRDAAVLAAGAEVPLRNPDVRERLAPLAARLAAFGPEALDRLEEARRRVRGNVNPRLAAEALFSDLARRGPA